MADDCPKEQKSETPALVSQKRVFVRNLPLSTNEQDLKNVFTEIGPILNASVVRDKDNKEIAKDENQEPPAKKFKGKKKSKSQRKSEGNELGRTVAITGLTYGLKPGHIRKRCGKIGNVEKVTFPVEGREKATAFVVFESHKDAREVVTKLSGRIFKGNTINVVLLSREGKAPSQKSPMKSKLIVRNLSFKCKPEELRDFFSKFGQVTDVHIPKKSDGERKCNAGFGFVQFSNVFEAAKAIKESNTKEIVGRPIAVDWAVSQAVYKKKALDKGLLPLESFRLSITKAVTPAKAAELKKEKKAEAKNENKDKRNLYLATEGLIYPGSTAAEGLSQSDLIRRQKAEREKKAKLADPNYFVSSTRLCVRNLPLNVDDKKLAEIFSTVTSKKVPVKKVLIMRSKDRKDTAGRQRSLGFGFVEFRNHKDALATLRATNNNPGIFSADRRPIVEFAVEKTKTNKAIRLKRNRNGERQDREREKRKRKENWDKQRRVTLMSPIKQKI